MRLRILQSYPNCRAMWTDGSRTLLTRGYGVLVHHSSGETEKVARLPSRASQRLLARWRPLRQALRLGVQNGWLMPNGAVLAIGRGALFLRPTGGERFCVVERFRVGNKPAFNGLVVDSGGRVYYGEYTPGRGRHEPVGVYRSDDGGHSFKLVHKFAPGEVRHIHFIQFDRYAQCLWMGTGDRDAECRLYCSGDTGASWELIGAGRQQWRAVGLIFTPEYLYWGTDAGSDVGTANYVIRWRRRDGHLEKLHGLQGPCHSASVLADGTLLVSTGVEGGANELDNMAHLWASQDGENWQELASWEKDCWPCRVQYGVIRFPHGLENSQVLHLTTLGLDKGRGESYYLATIEPG